MAIFQNRHDLFRRSGTSDKLTLFQSLLDSKELTSDQALALLTAIRNELEQPQQRSSSHYRQYAKAIESLHRSMPDVYEQVVDAWQQKRQPPAPPQSPIAESAKAEPGTSRTADSQEFEEGRERAEEAT